MLSKRIIASICLYLASVGSWACSITLNSGGNVQAALDTPNATTICLNQGVYSPSGTLSIGAGQSLIGSGNRDFVVLDFTTNSIAVTAASSSVIGNLTIQGSTGYRPLFGVYLGSGVSGVTVWGVLAQSLIIAFGTDGASSSSFLSNTTQYIGNPGNSIADPSHWFNLSSGITVQYGEFWGEGGGGSGDGEIASYNSSGIAVDSIYINYSGASGIYLVNCSSCSVTNSFIREAAEWGLDVVGGSTGFYANNNEITGAVTGAIVFQTGSGLTATITNNLLLSNDGHCGGTGVWTYGGPLTGVSMSGNYIYNSNFIGYDDVICND